MRKFAVWFAAGAMALAPLSAVAEYQPNTAQDYLLAHSASPWATMALSALGAGSIPSDHLKSVSGSSAIEYAAPVLAITSLGHDPRTFGNKDYIAEIKKYHADGQLGDPSALNDDIFGMLALVSAGEPTSDSAISDSKNFILGHQLNSGGWGFATSAAADSNTTAAAIVSLRAVGLTASDSHIQNALNYLKTAQNDDGGFTYNPESQWGTASDTSSTSWVVWALNANGINPGDWSKAGYSPLRYLESNQTAGGYFSYQTASGEDSFSAVTTAYAVVALAGKTLPLKTIAADSGFKFRIEGKNNTVCSGTTAGPTALDVVKNASAQCDFTYHIQSTSFGPYLDQIDDDKAAGLVGWMYLVNHRSPDVGADQYNLQNGDSVLWFYGDFNWKPARLSLSAASVDSGKNSSATVEYYENNSWSPLEGAKVLFGAFNATTDSAGKAQISAPDGYYQVSAEKDGYIRSNQTLLQIGSSSSNAVNLHAKLIQGQVEGATLAFTVDQSSLDFGSLKPGESASKNLSLKNTGTVKITLSGTVTGDDLFVSNLALDAGAWKNFSKSLTSEQNAGTIASLAVPKTYSAGPGDKNGVVTFWAAAAE